MSERKPRLYIDTCIISGMAKLDLSPQEIESIEKLLETYDAGEMELVTSGIAKQEIEKVPEEFQAKHRIIYLLLSKVPVAHSKSTTALSVMGIPGPGREDPLYAKFKQVLPDSEDAEHIFQAYKNRAQYFATVDQKTILRYRKQIEDCSGLKLGTPTELLNVINKTKAVI